MKMRLSLRRFLVLVALLAAVLLWIYNKRTSPTFKRTCHYSESFQALLHKQTAKVHEILNQLELTHFVCYGALWGLIRIGRTLPWANKAEICLLNEELTMKDEVYMHRMFRKHGFNLDYDFSDGSYSVTGAGEMPRVVLVVFEHDKLIGMYRRVGWKRRLLPPDCENFPTLDCFPPRLAVVPLPLKQFGSTTVPVPRESIELQKYHYRDNWWREVPTLNC